MAKKSIEEIEEDLVRNFTEKEREILAETEDKGAKPVSPGMSAQMLELFMESYSCAEIAKMNKDKGLTEGDILVCRKKYKWDEQKEQYAVDLNRQVREKLIKSKLEAIEFLTNTLAITHKVNNEKIKKYLQTGKEEDLPEDISWAKNPNAYRTLWETIQKITGEDRVQKQETKSEQKIIFESNGNALTKSQQSALLKKLVKGNE